MLVDLSQPRDETPKNILMWAHNSKNDSATFHCKVTIDGVRTKNGWNFPSCGSENYKKSVTRHNSQFFYETYRLELDVSDDTAHVIVVVMFDETAITLVKCYAESLMDVANECSEDHLSLSPALSNLIGTDHELRTVGSSTLEAVADIQTPKLKRLARHPSIATSSKPIEEIKKEWTLRIMTLKVAMIQLMALGRTRLFNLLIRKIETVEVDDSDADVSWGSGNVGTKGKAASHSAKEKRKTDLKDSDFEGSDDLANGTRKNKALQPSDKKNRNGLMILTQMLAAVQITWLRRERLPVILLRKKGSDTCITRQTHHRQLEIRKLDAAAAAQYIACVKFQE
nr:hypothetical protein [Tanacetum cinerariifolium]